MQNKVYVHVLQYDAKKKGLSKTPATRPTVCSLFCPQEDVSDALADWGIAFSLRLSG